MSYKRTSKSSDHDVKSIRILDIYSKLMAGEFLSKSQIAQIYDVDVRSIQRDFAQIRDFLDTHTEIGKELHYDQRSQRYYLRNTNNKELTISEIFAVCKILLESRSMPRKDMTVIIDKILEICPAYEEKNRLCELVKNEKYNYFPPHHNKPIIKTIWEVGKAIYEHRVIKMKYRTPGKALGEREIKPVGIMFSEMYFYLIAFPYPDDPEKKYPKCFRIDRIVTYEITDEHFQVPYEKQFKEGEFRKRIQFMFGGELHRIKFYYKGVADDIVYDRFPTAKLLETNECGKLFTAEIYGDFGFELWRRMQAEFVEVVENEKKS